MTRILQGLGNGGAASALPPIREFDCSRLPPLHLQGLPLDI